MPIWLRNFTFKQIQDFFKPQDTNSKSWVEGNAKNEASKNKVITPPTYITKASKK